MNSRPPTPSAIDPGAQSGQDTQYLFSEGDVRQSDADGIRPPSPGEFTIP